MIAIVALLVITAVRVEFFDRSWGAQVRWVVTVLPMLGFPGPPYPALTPLDLREVTLGWVRIRDHVLVLELLDRRADGRAVELRHRCRPHPRGPGAARRVVRDPQYSMVLYVDQAGVGS